MKDIYKIKLRSLGYRLVYRVDDTRIVVMVVAVGKRDKKRRALRPSRITL